MMEIVMVHRDGSCIGDEEIEYCTRYQKLTR